MRVRYKIVNVDKEQLDFMKRYKVCACTYCDYAVSIYCTFRGKKCPAGKEEYLKKYVQGIKKYKIQTDYGNKTKI